MAFQMGDFDVCRTRRDFLDFGGPRRGEFDRGRRRSDFDDKNRVLLGHGSFSTVERISYKGRQAAVKIFRSSDSDVQKIFTRFQKEADTLSKLQHENIVDFYGVQFVGWQFAIVMELMDGTLLNRIGKHDPALKKGNVLKDVATGLAYIHDKKIIHRDLKPSNVLLKRDRAKIGDIGLARFLQHDADAVFNGTRCPGTPPYMPPEAFSGSVCKYGRPLDVFSFGILALTYLTDAHPDRSLRTSPKFRFDSMGLKQSIPECQRRSVDLSRMPDDHLLKQLVLQCIKNKPADRPAASDFLLIIKIFTETVDSKGEHEVMRRGGLYLPRMPAPIPCCYDY